VITNPPSKPTPRISRAAQVTNLTSAIAKQKQINDTVSATSAQLAADRAAAATTTTSTTKQGGLDNA
jgi:hypothetical protein